MYKIEGILVLIFSLSVLHNTIRKRLLRKFKLFALRLVNEGYVAVPGISNKETIWLKYLSPQLKLQWEKNGIPEADPNDPTTWEKISEASQMKTSLKEYPGEPIIGKLISVQATYISLFDPHFSGLVHFSADTHWFLKLLINPFWVISEYFEPKHSLVLKCELGWKLPRFPTSYRNGIAKNWHTDTITHEPFVTTNCILEFQKTLEEDVFSMITSMVGSLLYFPTPGDVNHETGSTGMGFSGSNLEILKGLAAVRNLLKQPINIEAYNEALVKWLPLDVPISLRPVFRNEEVVCLTSFTPHTVVLPTRPMEFGRVRVVQNPKILSIRNNLKLADIPKDAPVNLLLSTLSNLESTHRFKEILLSEMTSRSSPTF